MEKNLKDLASCLKQAGEIVDKLNGTSTSAGQVITTPSGLGLQSAMSSISSTVERARSMVNSSSISASFARLNKKERLRAMCPQPSKKAKPLEKTFEFVFLSFEEEDGHDGEAFLLDDHAVKLRGFVSLDSFMDEKQIRNRFEEAIQLKYPAILGRDLEFLKANRRRLTKPVLAGEFTFKEIRLLAGQGCIYVKIKDGFECLLEDREEVSVQELVDKDESLMNLTKPASQTTRVSEPAEIPCISGTSQNEDQDPVNNSSDPIDQLIHTITQQCLSDPVEILRYLQQETVKGRVMDAVSESDENVGETNSICVDRQRILETTFTEFEAINDFSLTFEVDFMGELARDLGGPRKEWIRLMNMAIKDKYFDKGLREHLADEYYHVGIMMGIALLQNGQLPCYMPLDTIEKLTTVTSNKCISNIQRGLDVFGLAKIMRKFPILLHLLRPTNHHLTPKNLIRLLKPTFSEEGTTAFQKEKEIYSLFIKYVREVGSGRRVVTLESILIFCTGASEEPVLGFSVNPSIQFAKEIIETEDSPGTIYKYLPKAHTCTNGLILPIGPLKAKMPKDEDIFPIYDIAFANNFFGSM